jgi:GntR family histidine utilization transcriptional repressor
VERKSNVSGLSRPFDAVPRAVRYEDETLSSLHLDGQGPVWLQIRRALAQRITDGAWRPGTRIPAELDLTAHFNTSRMTVNKAIQSLASEGLLQRRRAIGTVVAERAQERPVFEIWDTADIIQRAGGVYSYRLLESAIVKDDPVKLDLLNVSRTTPLLWMRCLHLSGDTPFQLEDRLVNIEAAPGITRQPLETTAPGPWLLAHVPWTEAEHTISACEAGQAESEALALAVNAACLVVERRTWNGDVPVTLARLWHPGARHKLKGRFEPAR